MKPFTDDFSGFYKCRLVVKKIDNELSVFDTDEVYLNVIENQSKILKNFYNEKKAHVFENCNKNRIRASPFDAY